MKKEITWQTKEWKNVKVTIELVTKKTVDADGYKVDIKDCRMEITAKIDGMGIVGIGGIHTVAKNDKGIVARIGKLGLTKDHLDKINAAIAEIEDAPEWREKEKREEAANRQGEEYAKHYNTIKKMMAE